MSTSEAKDCEAKDDYEPFEVKPGVQHPTMPHWRIEMIVHSRGCPHIFKYQWVRRDGLRGRLNGWHSSYPQPIMHGPKQTTVASDRYDLQYMDQLNALGDDDLTLRTIRYYSSIPNYNEHPDGQPMRWM